MSDTVRGMIVYDRTSRERGVVTAGNQTTGMIAVQWDHGGRQIVHVSSLMSEKLYIEFLAEESRNNMALKASEATLNSVVYQAGKSAPLTRGKIGGPLANSLVIVEWDNGHISKVDIKHLLSEVVGLAENQRMVDEAERLEREFAQLESEVSSKISEAAKLIREAAALASSKNRDLQDMDSAYELENAMEAAGWRTSSWHC